METETNTERPYAVWHNGPDGRWVVIRFADAHDALAECAKLNQEERAWNPSSEHHFTCEKGVPSED